MQAWCGVGSFLSSNFFWDENINGWGKGRALADAFHRAGKLYTSIVYSMCSWTCWDTKNRILSWTSQIVVREVKRVVNRKCTTMDAIAWLLHPPFGRQLRSFHSLVPWSAVFLWCISWSTVSPRSTDAPAIFVLPVSLQLVLCLFKLADELRSGQEQVVDINLWCCSLCNFLLGLLWSLRLCTVSIARKLL